MTLLTIALLFLLCSIAAVSLLRIARLALPWKSRALLLGLRTSLLALITVAFIEPVIVLEQLPAQPGLVPVLIDASKSMRLFIRDSIISRTLRQLEEWNSAHPGKKQTFVFYSFGDSLIPLKSDVHSLTWSDRRSYLPESFSNPKTRPSNVMLLISDGNWSNASLPAGNYSDKTVFYLPLRDASVQPFLQIALPKFPDVSPIDSPLTATLLVEGVPDRGGDTLTIELIEKNRCLWNKKIPLSSGYFKEEVLINFRNTAPGRHLYRFEARMKNSSLRSYRYALHSKLPKQFYYSIYNSRPSLDRRFIQLALKRQHAFVESGADKTRHPDLLVLFDWDDKARQLFNDLKPGGTALFIGTLPCDSVQVRRFTTSPQVLRPQKETVSGNQFDNLEPGKLPPLSQVALCKSLAVMPQNIVLIAEIPAPNGPKPETINLLFTGRLNNRNYLACPARDIWRWDFLPLAVEPDEDRAFAFSQRLIGFSREMLVNALSGEVYLYPASPLTESDSLPFHVIFPVDIPVPSDVRLACRFTSTQYGAVDTVFVLQSTGATKQTVRFRPLPCGDWRLEATASAGNRRYQFADSVFIGEDRSEYRANTQNVTLLREIAQPIADFSASSLNSQVFSAVSGVNQPVRRTVNLNRNWPLLLLIFVFFSAEWILRRVWRLD